MYEGIVFGGSDLLPDLIEQHYHGTTKTDPAHCTHMVIDQIKSQSCLCHMPLLYLPTSLSRETEVPTQGPYICR